MAAVQPARTSEGAFRLIAAHLLVSDHCNHACDHCYQVHGQKGEMDLAQIDAVLGELANIGVLFLNLSGGEATLRPDLPAILRAARRRGFAITLFTNGYSLSDELHAAIVETGVWQVRVSIYSDRPEEHDSNTRVSGSLERSLENVRRLRTAGIQVVLVVPLTSHCSADVGRLEKLAASLDCMLEVTSGLSAREDGVDAPFAVSAGPLQLDAYFQAVDARHGDVPNIAEKLDKAPCEACSGGITIHSNGSVRPCTHIPTEFTSVSRSADSLASLPDDPAYQFIGGIRWRDLHGCRDCELVGYCSRCHGSAAFERGDMLGPQPSACARATARYEAQRGPLIRGPADEPGRDPEVGPYRLVGKNTLKPIPDLITKEDDARARRFPWIRPSKGHVQAMAGVIPGLSLVRRRDRGAVSR